MQHIIKDFKQIVTDNPNKIAIESNNKKITYLDLDKLSDKYALYFKDEGIECNSEIPIILNKSIDLIAVIIALYKIGAAFVPVSLKLSNVEKIIKNINPRYIITDSEVEGLNCPILNIKDAPQNNSFFEYDINNSDIAYIAFTSGTTGEPKKVKVKHNSLYNILNNMQQYFPVTSGDKYLFSTSYTFDVAIIEIFAWIKGRGSLVIGDDINSAKFFKGIGKLLSEYKVTHIAFVPTVIEQVINRLLPEQISKINSQMKYILLAGEVLSVNLVKKLNNLFPKVQLVNLYGPTETTIYSTYYKIPKDFSGSFVPIGYELDNYQIKIIDDKGEEVENENIGEICISGIGVADIYDRSSSAFIIINNQKFYKTGDFGIKFKDSIIKFIGRKDEQIKINGIRVEISDIEKNIENKIESIDKVKVIYYKKQLYCFYQSSSIKEKRGNIYNILKKGMPNHQIPNFFIKVDVFPFKETGKIDDKFLIKLIENKNRNERLNSEDEIINIFKSILEVDDISDNSNFFELGGDSLNAINVTIELEHLYHTSLDDYFLYQYPTPKKIKNYFENKIINEHSNKGNIENKTSIIKEIFYNNRILGEVNEQYSVHYLQKVYNHYQYQTAITFEINLGNELDFLSIQKAINQLIDKHPLLRSTLTKEKKQLFFTEYTRTNDYILNFSNDQKHIIEESFINDFYRNPYNRLLYGFIIIKESESYRLLCICSPYIADKSTSNVLMKDFNNFVNGNDSTKQYSWSYKEFIDNSVSFNKINKLMNHPHTKKIEEISRPQLPGFNKNGMLIMKVPITKTLTSHELINYSDYIATNIISNITNQKRVSYSTIFDRRKLQQDKFKDLIGDLHMSVISYGEKEEDFNTFTKRIGEVINEYKKGLNPMQAIYKDIPYYTPEQNKLYDIYVKNVLLKTNFIGRVRKEKLNAKIMELKQIKEELQNFPGDRLYVTSFCCEDNLYIGFLSFFTVTDEILRKYNISIVKKII